jgi:hypothetical protein
LPALQRDFLLDRLVRQNPGYPLQQLASLFQHQQQQQLQQDEQALTLALKRSTDLRQASLLLQLRESSSLVQEQCNKVEKPSALVAFLRKGGDSRKVETNQGGKK